MQYLHDPMGHAMWDYYRGQTDAEIIVHTSLDPIEVDIIPVQFLFRTYSELPELEKQALAHCRGAVLDIGAGAGSHALILQQQGFGVTALDISQGAVALMKDRGIQQAVAHDIFTWQKGKYDTLLLLMNGIGIAGTLSGLTVLLQHCRSLLKPGGQILLESTDIIYMYEDEEGAVWIDLAADYYGQCTYRMEYKTTQGEEFSWLYVDFSTLDEYAQANGYDCEVLFEGESFNYLAQLTLKTQENTI